MSIKLAMLRVNSIAGKILEIDESILSVAVVDMRGQIVSSKSRYHISNQFVSNYAKTDCSIWARAAFAMTEQCVNDFGKVETFVSTYEKMKVMVVPLASIDSLVVLTMLPSVSVEYVMRKLSALIDLCIHEKHSDKEYDIASGRQSVRK
jgi:hypothetical protein